LDDFAEKTKPSFIFAILQLQHLCGWLAVLWPALDMHQVIAIYSLLGQAFTRGAWNDLRLTTAIITIDSPTAADNCLNEGMEWSTS
jgi:hypothetical protein